MLLRRSRKGRTGFRQQLVITFCICVTLAALLSSIAIAYLSGQTIRDRFLIEGHQAAETLATQSTLALLYHSSENIQDYAEALMSSPDISGIAILDFDHQPLLEIGDVTMDTALAGQLPDRVNMFAETDRQWHFIAPVYTSAAMEDDSPFTVDQSQPELLGHVLLAMSKGTMRTLTGDLLKTNTIVSLTLAIALLAVLLLITGRVTGPINRLAATMHRATSGEGNIRADVEGPRDVTEMQEMFNRMMDVLEAREIELRKARDEALESARIKGEFAATVSHELRTPLNGVLGMLELLQGSDPGPKQHEYLKIAATSGESLLTLVNDILDFSKNDSGAIELYEEDISLFRLLDDIVTLFGNQVANKDLDIGYYVSDDVPHHFKADYKRLRQILVNLVGNAIKFTDQGEISIDVSSDAHQIVFEVSDTGIGIPEAAQQHIFEPFRQADGSTTRKYGGTGLGLAISRQLVEVMGGEISVSNRDIGATFRLWLPLRGDADAAQPSSNHLPAPTGIDLLVLDDSNAVRRMVRMHGEALGMRVHVAESIQEMHEILNGSSSADNDIDLILADSDLLASAEVPSDIRIVMTGNHPDEQDTGTANTSFIRKPVRASSLENLLTEMQAPVPGRSHDQVNSKIPARVLVVEDNRSNQYVVTGMLDHIGATVTVTSNGFDAIDALRSHEIDLVLMDCNMPEIDGYETTRRIRSTETGDSHVPIVAMTANTQESDILRCRESGMDDYISKPLRISILREKLRLWMQHSEVPTDSVTTESTGDDRDPQTEPAISQTLDRQFFSELRETLGTAFAKMLRVFVEDLPRYLSELEAALKVGAIDQVPNIAHTIKGSASNIGARRLAEICRHLEAVARKLDITTVRMLYNSVVAESEALITMLTNELDGKPLGQSESVTDHPAHILVVDDDRSTRVAFRNVLEDEGYQVFEAENGAAAIEYCNAQAPDLILMDGRMPVMDGFSACQHLKQHTDCSHIPVLIITGLEDEDSIEKAFSVGATDYISKPVNFSVLRKRIAHLMHASRAERHMHRLAYSDPLTGLPNRIRFTSHLDRLLHSVEDRGNRNLAVMFIDVDRFKLINDTLGHDAGDMLLKIVAERLHHCVRDGDMVARLGGDEFTVVLDDISSREVLAAIAKKICDAFSRPVAFLDQEIFITLSIGISMYPSDASDMASLMKHADTAMFNAKRYRNDFRFFEYGMEADVARRLKLENDLRRAVERDELEVHYQPQTEAGSGRLVGMEALVRWNHPERGMVPPADFISLAEDTGLISQVGAIVLDKACRQLRTWIDQGYPALRMAVNISARQLEKYEVINVVTRTLAETGIPPGCLELEITESVIMEHAEEMISVFRKLKAMGLHLAIDDFGTGYSSLAYLKRFPIDLLKVDRSFIQDIPDDQQDVAIITGVIAMARGLGLKIIAEGVETEAQVQFLREAGCDYMQGFYFSPPLPAAEFEQHFLASLRHQESPGSGNITPFKRGKPGY